MSVTRVASSTSSVTLASLVGRNQGAAIYNDSSATLYVLLDSGDASTTNFTVKLLSDDYYELPGEYEGEVKGIWASEDGAAQVTLYG